MWKFAKKQNKVINTLKYHKSKKYHPRVDMQSFVQISMRSQDLQCSKSLQINKDLENYKGNGNLSKPLGSPL